MVREERDNCSIFDLCRAHQSNQDVQGVTKQLLKNYDVRLRPDFLGKCS